jgi:hypothetical protein
MLASEIDAIIADNKSHAYHSFFMLHRNGIIGALRTTALDPNLEAKIVFLVRDVLIPGLHPAPAHTPPDHVRWTENSVTLREAMNAFRFWWSISGLATAGDAGIKRGVRARDAFLAVLKTVPPFDVLQSKWNWPSGGEVHLTAADRLDELETNGPADYRELVPEDVEHTPLIKLFKSDDDVHVRWRAAYFAKYPTQHRQRRAA